MPFTTSSRPAFTRGFALDPTFDMDGELKRLLPGLLREMFEPSRLGKAFASGILDYAHWLSSAPERLTQVLDTVSDGRVSVGSGSRSGPPRDGVRRGVHRTVAHHPAVKTRLKLPLTIPAGRFWSGGTFHCK